MSMWYKFKAFMAQERKYTEADALMLTLAHVLIALIVTGVLKISQ